MRATRGVRITNFYGNSLLRGTDLLALPNCTADSSFAVDVAYDEVRQDAFTCSMLHSRRSPHPLISILLLHLLHLLLLLLLMLFSLPYPPFHSPAIHNVITTLASYTSSVFLCLYLNPSGITLTPYTIPKLHISFSKCSQPRRLQFR